MMFYICATTIAGMILYGLVRNRQKTGGYYNVELIQCTPPPTPKRIKISPCQHITPQNMIKKVRWDTPPVYIPDSPDSSSSNMDLETYFRWDTRSEELFSTQKS